MDLDRMGMGGGASPAGDLVLTRRNRCLVLESPEPREALSWAIVGGGRRRARTIAWIEVDGGELAPPIDPRRFLSEQMSAHGITEGVGMLTTRSLDSYVDVQRSADDWSVRCVATVGLGNALRVGDPAAPIAPVGTVNLLCAISRRLGEEAMVEAVALAAEARAAALLEASVPSGVSGRPATGTGTDCIVVWARDLGPAAAYVGKHTVPGHLIGSTVCDAVRLGVGAWLAEQRAGGVRR